MSTQNVLFADLALGQQYHRQHLIRRSDVEMLGMMGGKVEEEGQIKVPATGVFLFLTATATNSFPGPGSLIREHGLRSSGWVHEDDILNLTLTVSEKHASNHTVTLEAVCENQHGDRLCSGPIQVAAPTEKQRSQYAEAPQFTLRAHHVFAELRAKTDLLPAVPTAVVHPCDPDSLLGAMAAAHEKLIVPILVGPEGKIRALAQQVGVDLAGVRIVGTEHSHASALKAVELCRNGEASALMKGSLHTDEMMSAVMSGSTGLRGARRISHVFVMDVPAYERALLVTDAAINIAPTLADKVDITQNAIDLAHILGIECPKVALLSAVETVSDKMPSTMDAALLCKMADRGQIHGAQLDGPLAFDNAISMAAAKTKKINSPVAGQADILVVPDIEAGNMLAKQMSYFAAADSAGIVLGARVPIVLTSRADDVKTRLASAAVMVLVAHARK